MKAKKLLLLLVLLTTGILLIVGLYTKQMKMKLDTGKDLSCNHAMLTIFLPQDTACIRKNERTT